MRNEKRTLFPSGEKELEPRVRRTSSLLYIPNHLSFKGMFMFEHFSPSIVPKETELMRMLFAKYLHVLQWLSSSRWVGTESRSQHPTFLMPIFRPRSDKKYTTQMTTSIVKW